MRLSQKIKEFFRAKGENSDDEEKLASTLAEDPISQAIVENPKPEKRGLPGMTRAGRVLIASLEDQGTRLVLDYVENPGPGCYDDATRGLGGQYLPARPLTVINHGKPEFAFLVDGDRGVPIKMEVKEIEPEIKTRVENSTTKEGTIEALKNSVSILSLTCSARQAHALLDAHVFAEAYRQRMLGREKLMYIALIILANLIGVVLHV